MKAISVPTVTYSATHRRRAHTHTLHTSTQRHIHTHLNNGRKVSVRMERESYEGSKCLMVSVCGYDAMLVVMIDYLG